MSAEYRLHVVVTITPEYPTPPATTDEATRRAEVGYALNAAAELYKQQIQVDLLQRMELLLERLQADSKNET